MNAIEIKGDQSQRNTQLKLKFFNKHNLLKHFPKERKYELSGKQLGGTQKSSKKCRQQSKVPK